MRNEKLCFEAEVITQYANRGWVILNKAKTGKGIGSLGGYNYLWDKEACREEALKYKNRKAFHKNSAGAYTASLNNVWLEEFFPNSQQLKHQKPKGYWDVYEHCQIEASQYHGRNEFKRGNQVAYRSSSLHGWLDDFFPR